ncbi:preQ(1) synthase [Desulfurispira natronophila]|uniref:NADPH-dependent 7-cyano-7-deazaguanine reductase n=1 Tax=Desulfurispira natronophila TaxID=682562 RepID=A0A7W7Y2I2_9BACT|nr:preQ(1) synthase [Desulfurispira natronophila]MBB5020858.1 7-cyano-7-deazaguanine reductase [Desulfurispira natronophila]
MAMAEGKRFKFDDTSHIETNFLETFPYEGHRQFIQYRTEEFSAVCPFSGLPDMGTVVLEYIPDTCIVELKSYKYYLVSFRNVGIYQEQVTSRIFGDLWHVLTPQFMKLTTIYRTRGGIDTTCTVQQGDADPYLVSHMNPPTLHYKE